MSSTLVKNRLAPCLDFYQTPDNAVLSLLGHYPFAHAKTALEPSAGKGAIAKHLKKKGLHTTSIEIQPQFKDDLASTSDKVVICDFLTENMTGRLFDLVVANPPYSMAQPFIEKCLTLLSPGGSAAFLLRLSFAGSIKRMAFFKEHRPLSILVLTQRPKFGGNNIDSCDYAWFVWGDKSSPSTEFAWAPPVRV